MAARARPRAGRRKDPVPGPDVHLFDGHVYIFRAYHSLPPMRTPEGLPCQAAYGFANTLIRYLAEERPTHAAVCLDAAMTSFRNELEPLYKAQRGEPPEDLEPQFAICREIAEALGFSTWEVADYEADDLIGTIADAVVRLQGSVRVLTTDKDLCQLVREDGRVVVHDLARQKTFDAEAVRDRFGVSPGQIPDYLGLVGDSVDNLPGVPGIGPKSAAAVLSAFGTIEAVPSAGEAWSQVPIRGAARLAAKIAEHRARALRTRELATVIRTVPGVDPSLEGLAHRGADREQVAALFDRLGWNRIRDRVPRWRGQAPERSRSGPP